MPWATAAAVAGVGLASGYMQSQAAGDAADTQAASADRATQLQADQFRQTREDQAPYRALASEVALPGIRNFLTTNNSQISNDQVRNDPGYQFGINERQRLMRNSLAAGSGLYRGSTANALGRDAQDYASTRFNDVYNRMETARNNQFNRYATAAGIGQVANNQVSAAGQNYATQAGSNMIGAGNAQGAASIAQGNVWGNALNQGISSYNQYQNANPYASMGFNGSNGAGFTNSQPWTVGPQQQ